MKKKQNSRSSDSDRSSEDKYPVKQSRFSNGPLKEEVNGRTRSRNKLSYNPRQEVAQTKKERLESQNNKYKVETKIQKKYLVDPKDEQADDTIIKKKEQFEQKNVISQYQRRQTEIPLKMTKYDSERNKNNIKILADADRDAFNLLEGMNNAFVSDVKAFHLDRMAFHKIKFLTVIRQKIKNVYTKRKFIQKKGLDQFFKWLLPFQDKKGRQLEPGIAIKMGILRVVQQMGLQPQQITDYGTLLHEIINKNKELTIIPELKDICSQILVAWDYTIYRKLNSDGMGKR